MNSYNCSIISLPRNEKGMMKVLCQTSEQALKRIERSRINREKFLSNLRLVSEEQNRRIELLKMSMKRFEESVYMGRLTNAKNREQHMVTMQKLCTYLEADPQQKDDLEKLEVNVDRLLEQVMTVHKEHYQFEKRFDAEDVLNRVQEMSYQVNVLEKTFSKALAQSLMPGDAVMVLANSATRDEAESLAARLKTFFY